MDSTSKQTTNTSGDDRNLVRIDDEYLGLGFEDRLRMFWERYSRVITVGACVVALVIVGRGVVGWMAERQEQATRAEFAAAEGKDALLAFAAAHPTHVLAGVARLRVADEQYAAGDFAAAGASYRDAVAALGESPLAGRALLGAAVSVIEAGKTEEGATVLRQLADDVARSSVVRAEAAFHLAVMARDAGQFDEANRRVEQVDAMGDTGLWGQRSLMLRAELARAAPVKEAAPAAKPEVPADTVTFKAP